MRRIAALALLLAGCRSVPADDDTRLRRLMGRNDRWKLEVQLLTAEPDASAEIQRRLREMARAVREAGSLRPFPEEERNGRLAAKAAGAAAELEALAGEPWPRDRIEANWNRLEVACAACHTSLR